MTVNYARPGLVNRDLLPARLVSGDGPTDAVGLLQIAVNKEILTDLRKKATFNRIMGVESHELSPAEIKKMWPIPWTDDVLTGFYTEGDGRANPAFV